MADDKKKDDGYQPSRFGSFINDAENGPAIGWLIAVGAGISLVVTILRQLF